MAPNCLPGYVGASQCARKRNDPAASLAYFDAAASGPYAGHTGVQMARAFDMQALRQFEAAEAVYSSVLAEAPCNMSAHIGLGQCARERGDRTLALQAFQAAVAAAPLNPLPLIALAFEHQNVGNLDEAEVAYTNALVIARDNPSAWLGLGNCARKRGNHLLAFALFQAGTIAAPANPSPALEAAAELCELGQTGQADAMYARVLEAWPQMVQAHLGRARCARKRGDRRMAIAHGQAAITAEPASLWPILDVANDYRAIGELDKAEECCRRAITLAPENAQAYWILGAVQRTRGDRAGAMKFFRAAAAMAPDEPWPLIELAVELRELGELEEAQAQCARALVLAPGSAQAMLGLGLCARARGERDAALVHFAEAAAADPSDVTPWLEIAVEQRETGDLSQAIETARQVLTRQPGNLKALMSIGVSERVAGRHAAAMEAFAAAQAAHPHLAEPLVEMAIAARALGRQAECDDLLAKAARLDPQNVSVMAHRAMQAFIARDVGGAETIYRLGLEHQPRQLALRLGLVDVLAGNAQPDAALEALDKLECEQGTLPAIICKRIGLLRRVGKTDVALRTALRATATFPQHFPYWVERMNCELLIGTDEELDVSLAALRPATQQQRATVARLCGCVAESRWQLDEAVGHYERALALNPQEAGTQHDLVRLQVLKVNMKAARKHLRRFCDLTAHVTRLQGKSLNLSQTHFGQIIDEYSLDAALLKSLAAAQLLPSAARIGVLRELVRANPDSSAASVSLMVALRQDGVFTGRAGALPATPIPACLTQYWNAAKPPADIVEIMRSWREMNPAFPLQLFNEISAQEFLAAHYADSVLAAYRRVREPAQKADIFLLGWLAAKGGIYADADDRCIAPLAGLLPAGAQLVLYQEDHGTVGNNFIAAVPGHPVLVRALASAVTAINRGDTDFAWLSTGPALLTRALTQFLAHQPVDSTIVPPGIFVLDRRELFRAVAIHCATGYKAAGRHWSNATFARQQRRVAQRKAVLF